jgi:hypothetical protein
MYAWISTVYVPNNMDTLCGNWGVSDLEKLAKEAHIHGGRGTSLGELNMLFSSMVFGEILLLCLLPPACGISKPSICKGFLLLILPQMAVITSLVVPKSIFLLNALAILIAGLQRWQLSRRLDVKNKSAPRTSWAHCAELTSRTLYAEPRG